MGYRPTARCAFSGVDWGQLTVRSTPQGYIHEAVALEALTLAHGHPYVHHATHPNIFSGFVVRAAPHWAGILSDIVFALCYSATEPLLSTNQYLGPLSLKYFINDCCTCLTNQTIQA